MKALFRSLWLLALQLADLLVLIRDRKSVV